MSLQANWSNWQIRKMAARKTLIIAPATQAGSLSLFLSPQHYFILQPSFQLAYLMVIVSGFVCQQQSLSTDKVGG